MRKRTVSKKDPAKEELDFEYYFGNDFGTPSVRRTRYDHGEERPSLELYVASKQNLTDHLEWQLSLTDFPEKLQDITDFIVGNLNTKGYLLIGTAEIAEQLKRPETEVAEALEVVQSLDPAGVGARDLKECIILQLGFLGLKDTLAWRLVSDYLALVEKRKFREITKKLDCSMDELKEALDVLKRLVPLSR